MGSFVWVEDPDEAWIDGEVVQVNGDEIKVLCTSGKHVCVCVCVRFSSKLESQEDF